MLLLYLLALAGCGAGAAASTRSAPPPPGPPPGAPLASGDRLQWLADTLARPFAPEEGVSSLCRQHSQLYLRALGQLEPWAMYSEYEKTFTN